MTDAGDRSQEMHRKLQGAGTDRRTAASVPPPCRELTQDLPHAKMRDDLTNQLARIDRLNADEHTDAPFIERDEFKARFTLPAGRIRKTPAEGTSAGVCQTSKGHLFG
jgi:hypothetical protein